MKENDDLFLNTLINETYKDSATAESPCEVEELRFYFEKKLNEVDHASLVNYLDQNKIEHSSLSHNQTTRCYRMSYNEQVLDFPENWSFFKEIENEDFIYIDEDMDADMLLDIFSEMVEMEVNILVIKDESELRLIYLNRFDDKQHLEWTRIYLEKQKNIQKKAA